MKHITLSNSVLELKLTSNGDPLSTDCWTVGPDFRSKILRGPETFCSRFFAQILDQDYLLVESMILIPGPGPWAFNTKILPAKSVNYTFL